MRRGLAFTALFFLVVGLELSTQAMTLVGARLRAGIMALATGTPFHVSGLRFSLGIGLLLVGVGLSALVIWSRRHEDAVTLVGSTCPQCGNKTRRVKRREMHRLLAVVMGVQLSRRRCDTCGWTGLSTKH